MTSKQFEQRFKWKSMKSSKRGAIQLLRDVGPGWCIVGVQVYRDGERWAVVMTGSRKQPPADHAATCDDAMTNAEQRVRRWYKGEVEFTRPGVELHPAA